MFAAIIAFSLSTPPAAVAEEKAKDLPEAAQKELKKLEGKWKATALSVDGQERALSGDGSDVFLTFKGKKVIITRDEKEYELFEIPTLDPSTSPKILDLKALVDEMPVRKGTTYETIYKIDGETLTIAVYIGEGNKRPAKFESEKDSAVVVVTLKREKK